MQKETETKKTENKFFTTNAQLLTHAFMFIG